MKKNISINISGIIFHIEEDGYDLLKSYLTSINRYFSTYEDSAEIISDIENRIAEIFLAKLGENKQVITVEDINDLIATMGSVSDFEAAEADSEPSYRRPEEPLQAEEPLHDKQDSKSDWQAKNKRSPRKLYRDLKRKLVGGVASGIAHYLSIDPLWIRLAFMATLVDVIYFTSLSGIALAAYGILWAVLPGSEDLPDDQSYKRLFRNPEDRVLGGVAGGLAAYFGVDVLVVRLLFVLGIFLGGVGIITYLIFWMITPEAKTLTDKMQMEGEPVTLSNIERKIKEGLDIDPEQDEENTFVKILLFPFRLLSLIIATLTKIVQPFGNFLGQMLRVVAALAMVVTALISIISLVIIFSTLMGMIYTDIRVDNIPLSVFSNSVPVPGIVALFITIIVPMIALGIAGLSLLARRRIVGSVAAWSLFGIWISGIALTSAIIPSVLQQWQAEEILRTEQVFSAAAAPFVLEVNNLSDNKFDRVELTIKGYEGNEMKLVRMAKARGSDAQNALENARMAQYNTVQQANIIQFDKGYGLDADAVFRGQHINLELLVPYGQEFIMHPNLGGILRHTLYPHGYDAGDLNPNHRWKFTEEGLKCLNCPPKEENTELLAQEIGIHARRYTNYSDFSKLLLVGDYDVKISRGNRFQVVIDADNAQATNHISLLQEGDLLKIINKATGEELQNVRVIINLPKLSALSVKGQGEVKVAEFKTKDFDLQLEGDINCEANIKAQTIKTAVNGKSVLQLDGAANTLIINASQEADCDAFDLKAKEVIATATDNSSVKVYADRKVLMNTTGQAEISYKGSPKVVQTNRD
jgi:phage shock protein PspC (stress-responsive transcriptional regulator)